MFITPSFKKSLIVEQFQGNYLKEARRGFLLHARAQSKHAITKMYASAKSIKISER